MPVRFTFDYSSGDLPSSWVEEAEAPPLWFNDYEELPEPTGGGVIQIDETEDAHTYIDEADDGIIEGEGTNGSSWDDEMPDLLPCYSLLVPDAITIDESPQLSNHTEPPPPNCYVLPLDEYLESTDDSSDEEMEDTVLEAIKVVPREDEVTTNSPVFPATPYPCLWKDCVTPPRRSDLLAHVMSEHVDSQYKDGYIHSRPINIECKWQACKEVFRKKKLIKSHIYGHMEILLGGARTIT